MIWVASTASKTAMPVASKVKMCLILNEKAMMRKECVSS